MKKLITITTLLLSLVFAGTLFAAPAHNGAMPGMMMNQQKGMMAGCGCLSPEKMAKMQAAREKLQTVRQQLLNTQDPVAGKELLQKHLVAMQECLDLMPASCGNGQGCKCKGKMMNGRKCGMMAGNQAMTGCCRKMKNGCPCRQMMREVMVSMKAQLKMMAILD